MAGMQGVSCRGSARRVGQRRVKKSGERGGVEEGQGGESGSRGGLWVMLRDETPRGFIEERREEDKEPGGGGVKKERRKKDRNAEAGSALILKSTLVRTHHPHPRLPPITTTFSFFAFLSFSLFQSCGTGSAARRKSNRPPAAVSWG